MGADYKAEPEARPASEHGEASAWEPHWWGTDGHEVLLTVISKQNGTNGLSCYISSIFDGLETI